MKLICLYKESVGVKPHSAKGFTLLEKTTRSIRSSLTGFTLIEVLIAAAILTIAVAGTMGMYTRSLSLVESDRSFTLAQYEVRRQLEEVLSNDYVTIRTTWTNAGAIRETPFNLLNASLNGRGVIYAEEMPGAADGLIRIKIAVSYLDRSRLVGEDANLNGKLDGGEDANANAELDSPCQMETTVPMREM